MGAGVPRPVQPKSHTQRSMTAKPRMEGTAPSQRQCAASRAAARKPSLLGSSQNQKAKKAAPTAREAKAVSERGREGEAGSVGIGGSGVSMGEKVEITNQKSEIRYQRTEEKATG